MSAAVDLVKRGFEAFAAGDVATLDQLLADDVVWVGQSGGILAGRFEGKQAVFGNWALIPAETGGTFQQDVVEVFGDDTVVVAVVENTATRGDRQLDRVRGAIVFVVKDGKLTQGRVISGDPEQTNAFWA